MSRELDVAVEAARRGGRVLMEKRRVPGVDAAGIAVGEKGERDYVTEADRGSEAAVIETIRKAFPGDAIVAEESAGADRDAGARPGGQAVRRWIIDPLDGTVNYIHGYPMFCVSVGFEAGGRLEAGAILDPLHDELFTAERGHGAFLNGRRIRVNAVGPGGQTLGESLVTTGFPYRIKPELEQYLESFRRIFLEVGGIRRAGAACLDFAYTACGRADGFWEFGLCPWDIAAGALLVEEAGGIVTDFAGGADYLASGRVIAGAPAVHAALLNIIRESFGGV